MAASARNYWIAAGVILVIILWGSLYPLIFVPRHDIGGALGAFIDSVHDQPSSRGDILANIALYAPLGFFLALALSRPLGLVLSVIVITLFALMLSTSIELTQFYIPGRYTSVYDAANNTLGGFLGALIGGLVGGRVRFPLLRNFTADPVAALILAAFFGYRLYPYVPTIDLHKYLRAVRGLTELPGLSAGTLARQLVMWLVVICLVEALFGRRRAMLLAPLLMLAEWAGKILILDNLLSAPDVFGGMLAFLLWVVALSWMGWRSPLIAIAFCVLVIADRLAPFRFALVPHDFDWMPFFSLIGGSPSANLIAFLEKFFQYGGLIWLLRRSMMPLPFAALFVAAVLFATALAETYLPSRSASLTDALMALVIAAIFALLGSARVTAA